MGLVTNKTTYGKTSNLLSKLETDGLQGIECFETFIEIVEACICDLSASMHKSTSLFYKNLLPFKVEMNGL